MKDLPSLKTLNECFSLDSSCPSGLRWKERPRHHFSSDFAMDTFNRNFKNLPAGSKGKQYFVVEILKQTFFCHRIVYAIFNKNTQIQKFQIDHINQKKLDNSPENLRLTDNSLNQLNKRETRANSSGFSNVGWDKDVEKWEVVFRLRGKKIRLGRFFKKQDAIETRDSFILSNCETIPFLNIPDYF